MNHLPMDSRQPAAMSLQACATGSILTATMIADSTIALQKAAHPEARMRDVYQQAWGAPTPPAQVTHIDAHHQLAMMLVVCDYAFQGRLHEMRTCCS